MRRRHALATGVVAVCLALTACSGEGDPDQEATTPPPGATASVDPNAPRPDMTGEPTFEFVAADVTFLRQMLPHHDQAIALAQLAAERAQHPELAEFAGQAIAMRQAQVTEMEALASAEGESIDPSDHAAAADAPGMLTTEEVQALSETADEAFDLAFLDLFIRHDEGGIEITDTTLNEGDHPEILVLAIDALEAFEAEVEQLQEWQEAWS